MLSKSQRLKSLTKLLLTFLVLGQMSCNSQATQSPIDDLKVNENGLKYSLISVTSPRKAKIGDIMVLNMRYKADTLKLFDTWLRQRPVYFQVTHPHFKGSFEEGLFLLGKGDSALFITSADSVFSLIFDNELPGRVKTGAELWLDIKVEDLYNEEEDINAYIQGKNFETLPTGLRYKQITKGNGEKTSQGKKASIHYESKYLNGKLVQSTYDRGFTFKTEIGKTGMGEVIDGWKEALNRMQVGDKIEIVVPSYLGYGPRFFGDVPPFTPLVYTMELVDLK